MEGFTRRADGLFVPAHLALPGAAVVFCDESGNSGPNYLDVAQPFYVLAGWLVPDSLVTEAAVLVETFRRDHFGQLPEFKAAAILRSNRTKQLGAQLFRRLGELGCVPLQLVAEKRFCVAGKVVETFLDPAFNHLLKDAFTGDVETKKEIANTLYEQIEPAALNEFAEAYRKPTSDAIEQALRTVAGAVDRDVSSALARAVLGSVPQIAEIARAEGNHWLPNNVDATLNLPCLVSFLMLIENLARLGLAQPVHIVHDQQHTYEEGYKRIFELHRGFPRLFARLPSSSLTYGGLEHVATFETRASLDSPLVQAADLLAGTMAHAFKLAMSDDDITDADLELVDLLAPGLVCPEPLVSWLVCSDRCIERIAGRVLRPCLERIMPDLSVTERDAALAAAPTPMFPSKSSSPRSDTARVRLDFPLVAIVGTQTGQLFIVDNPDVAPSPAARFAVIFSSRIAAERFLGLWNGEGLTEPQSIVEFTPRNVVALVALLLDVAKWTPVVAFDPSPDADLRLTPTLPLAEGIQKSLDRVSRLFVGGLDRVLTERVQIGTREVLVMQASDGRFGALIPPDGAIYYGQTGADALASLRTGEGLQE